MRATARLRWSGLRQRLSKQNCVAARLVLGKCTRRQQHTDTFYLSIAME